MATQTLDAIESEFAKLPPEAQLTLLERLVHRVRLNVSGPQDSWDAELAAMANDPEMQRELRDINADFAVAETDGLGRG